MTILAISVFHPLLKRQCVLATMDCEEENFQNSKMFWNCWNTALQEHSNKPSYTFSPTGIFLDESGCNWKALEEVYGKEFVELCSSCEFHFKQSVHRRGKKAYFSSEDCISKFIYNSKQILEAQTCNQFEDAVNVMEDFISEEEKRWQLRAWLAWWVGHCHHIFRAFKRKMTPRTNLAEVVHSFWVTLQRTHLSLYESAIEDIAEQINIKQMLKAYDEGSFSGGTGPSSKTLQQRNEARANVISSKILDAHEDANESNSSDICSVNINDGRSPPRVVNNTSSKTKCEIWNDSCEDSEDEEFISRLNQKKEKRCGSRRGKRSSDFLISLKNAKQ